MSQTSNIDPKKFPANVIPLFQSSDLSAVGKSPETFEKPQIISDGAQINVSFNVMNDRPVMERFIVKEYRIWNRYGEATFDREYFSSMDKSPDHLIFLTGCVHSQKLLYLVLLREFGFQYAPDEKEFLKIWPTSISIDMPKMVRQNSDVIQKLTITQISKVSDSVYKTKLVTTYNDIVTIRAESNVYLI